MGTTVRAFLCTYFTWAWVNTTSARGLGKARKKMSVWPKARIVSRDLKKRVRREEKGAKAKRYSTGNYLGSAGGVGNITLVPQLVTNLIQYLMRFFQTSRK